MVRLISNIHLNREKEDKISFSSDEFTAKNVYDILNDDAMNNDPEQYKVVWKKLIPSKITFWVWFVLKNAIATQDNLKRRGITLVNRCWLCHRHDEEASHLLLHCSFSQKIWSYFVNAQRLSWVQNFNVSQCFHEWKVIKGSRKTKTIWSFIPYAIMWAIWPERNARAFNGKEKSWNDVILNIKSFFLIWLYRKKFFEGRSLIDLHYN